eukprot:1159888-Pelagomonas_calceolata.AAC.10
MGSYYLRQQGNGKGNYYKLYMYCPALSICSKARAEDVFFFSKTEGTETHRFIIGLSRQPNYPRVWLKCTLINLLAPGALLGSLNSHHQDQAQATASNPPDPGEI